MLELADPAPVALRERVRGLLWVIGSLTRPEPAMGRRWAARVADVHPDPALLDIGHGLTVLLMRPGSIVVSDGDGTAPLSPVELAAAARPDPFCRFETSCSPTLRKLTSTPRRFGPWPATCRRRCATRGRGRWASTAAACGCGSRPRRATTTSGWGGAARSRRPPTCVWR